MQDGKKTEQPVLTWDDVLKDENLIGGEIESHEGGTVYRGPISKIARSGEMVEIISPWCARLNPESGEWEKWDVNTSAINPQYSTPQQIGNGRVMFSMMFIGTCVLFPKTGSKIDPEKVKGLPKNWERLLTLYPDLRFDRTLAEKVLKEKSFHATAEKVKALEATCTLQDVLAQFRNDSSREEFLWFYIEEATEEKDVHNKVY